MKRVDGLFDGLASYDNLIAAAYQAARGKRMRPDVIAFNRALADNLTKLRRELLDGTYRPGPYREFTVYEAKPRRISAAPYRDRVVHHVLCNAIMPVLSRAFVDTSFANRPGKGTHRAVLLCRRYLCRYSYYLKCDVCQYFPSIDHEILEELLRRKIRCARTLALAHLVIDCSNPQDEAVRYFPGDDLFSPYDRRRGIPIGNLTSQELANVYLTPLDHFVRERLGIRGYIRYVDDFVLFHDDKRHLARCKREIRRFLASYRLAIHAEAQPVSSSRGISFLGYRVYRSRIRVQPGNVVRARRRLKARRSDLEQGRISPAEFRASVSGWTGHAGLAHSPGLLRSVVGGSWRAG